MSCPLDPIFGGGAASGLPRRQTSTATMPCWVPTKRPRSGCGPCKRCWRFPQPGAHATPMTEMFSRETEGKPTGSRGFLMFFAMCQKKMCPRIAADVYSYSAVISACEKGAQWDTWWYHVPFFMCIQSSSRGLDCLKVWEVGVPNKGEMRAHKSYSWCTCGPPQPQD
jgi:hypothetical protein